MPANDYLDILSRRPVPRFGRVLVAVEKEHEDEIQVGGTTLYLDSSYRPLHHVQEFGTVVATPLEMRPWDKTPCEVQGGDRVRMHYFAIADDNLVELAGKRFWLVPYDQLYYVEQPDRSVRMLNTYCLVEPTWTRGGEERTAAGIITNLCHMGRARPVANRGILRHVHERCKLPLGVEVAYINDADLPLPVNGTTYYLMQHDRDLLVEL